MISVSAFANPSLSAVNFTFPKASQIVSKNNLENAFTSSSSSSSLKRVDGLKNKTSREVLEDTSPDMQKMIARSMGLVPLSSQKSLKRPSSSDENLMEFKRTKIIDCSKYPSSSESLEKALITPPLENRVYDASNNLAPANSLDRGTFGDEEEVNDPQMASEYIGEIFAYLRDLEMEYLPSNCYIKNQKELTWEMRTKIVDWLYYVHYLFRLQHETFHLATHLLDRFLSMRSVSRTRLQLVALTALFIASKFKEIMTPCVDQYLLVCSGEYTREEFLQAERYMLNVFKFVISYPNPLCFLRKISKADGYDENTRAVAKFFLDTSFLVAECVGCPPSLTTSASMWLARHAIGMQPWNSKLEACSEYEEEAVTPIAGHILRFLAQSALTEFSSCPTLMAKYRHVNIHHHNSQLAISRIIEDWLSLLPPPPV